MLRCRCCVESRTTCDCRTGWRNSSFRRRRRTSRRISCVGARVLPAREMLLSGTTTYTDMYYFEEVIAEATKECGMRGVLGQTLIGFPAPDAKTAADGLKRSEAFLERFRTTTADRACCRSARCLHQFRGNLESRSGPGQSLRCPAADSPLRNQDAKTTNCWPSAI